MEKEGEEGFALWLPARIHVLLIQGICLRVTLSSLVIVSNEGNGVSNKKTRKTKKS